MLFAAEKKSEKVLQFSAIITIFAQEFKNIINYKTIIHYDKTKEDFGSGSCSASYAQR